MFDDLQPGPKTAHCEATTFIVNSCCPISVKRGLMGLVAEITGARTKSRMDACGRRFGVHCSNV